MPGEASLLAPSIRRMYVCQQWSLVDIKYLSVSFVKMRFPSCVAFLAAGCIIGSGRSYATDAVPLLPVYFTDLGRMTGWVNPLMLIQWKTGLELRTLGPQASHANH